MGSPDSLTSVPQYSIVLFDGVCNLCNGAVQFIIKRDQKKRFRFASLQSQTARQYLKRYSIDEPELYSIVLVKNGKVYDRSAAVLEIAKDLSGPWAAFYFFKIIPSFLRNMVYRFVAKNRYRLFGKKDQCMIPGPELKARFLE